MLISQIAKAYLEKVWAGIQADAIAKRQKIPTYYRIAETDTGAMLFVADYFKYLVFGRGPGKFPPPDKMLDFVHKNPEILAKARQTYKNISEKSLAYLIGRKIAMKGTAIYEGKKPGVDVLETMEANMPDLLKVLVRNEAVKIMTSLRTELKTVALFLMLTLASCSPRAVGYRNYPLPPAYIPKRFEVNIGPIVLLDIQILKWH